MTLATPINWPSPRDFVEAVQFPHHCFSRPDLQKTTPAVDRLGLPRVASGQFAYVFKLLKSESGKAVAVRCFGRYVKERGRRYEILSSYLARASVTALAAFKYEPEGMLVGGRKYPILVMEWIEGSTLDVCIEKVLGKPDVLRQLADQWLEIVESLGLAKVAHGDLQHGNVIVQDGRLRLVDFDGMFVASLDGQLASEVGHEHYQHPARSARLFNARLDNFSALVIYLSLISLAERPTLWAEHHDESLLFTKLDYLRPEKSRLLSQVKEIGPEHRRLAEVLETVSKGAPDSVPCLLNLIRPSSKLPAWMREPFEFADGPQTNDGLRAETHDDLLVGPLAGAQPGMSLWTPSSCSTKQVLSWRSILAFTVLSTFFGVIGLYTCALWLPILLTIYGEFAVTAPYSKTLSWLSYGLACLMLSAKEVKSQLTNEANHRLSSPPNYAASPAQIKASPIARALSMSTNTNPPALLTASSLVGSRMKRVYHQSNCRWANAISQHNRRLFYSRANASAAGFRRCAVCTP